MRRCLLMMTAHTLIFAFINIPLLHAAPDQPSPILEIPATSTSPGSGPTANPKNDFETMDIQRIEKSPSQIEKVEPEYTVTTAMGPRFGMSYLSTGEPKLGYSFGAFLMFTTGFNTLWEVSFDALSRSQGILYAAKRWDLFRSPSFRPFVKIGPACQMEPKEGLATLFPLKNYQLRGTAGFEKSIDSTSSVKMDFEAAVGVDNTQAAAILGYSWGW